MTPEEHAARIRSLGLPEVVVRIALDVDARLRDRVLNVGVVSDRLAECGPRLRTSAHQFQRALGH